MSDIFERLADVIAERRTQNAEDSYVASLFEGGIDKILKKIGEEASETIIAGKGGDKSQTIYETADLWFHSLVLLEQMEIRPEQVLNELERRFGISGHTEKAARNSP